MFEQFLFKHLDDSNSIKSCGRCVEMNFEVFHGCGQKLGTKRPQLNSMGKLSRFPDVVGTLTFVDLMDAAIFYHFSSIVGLHEWTIGMTCNGLAMGLTRYDHMASNFEKLRVQQCVVQIQH